MTTKNNVTRQKQKSPPCGGDCGGGGGGGGGCGGSNSATNSTTSKPEEKITGKNDAVDDVDIAAAKVDVVHCGRHTSSSSITATPDTTTGNDKHLHNAIVGSDAFCIEGCGGRVALDAGTSGNEVPLLRSGSKHSLDSTTAAVSSSSTGTAFIIDEHPLTAGNFLVVRYRDGSHRLAKIIETAQKQVRTDGILSDVYNYYVHYVDFNRRMDEWISSDRIVMLPSEANVLEMAKRSGHHSIVQGNLECKRLLQDAGDDSFFPITKKMNLGGSSQNLLSMPTGQSGVGANHRRRSQRSTTPDGTELGDESGDNEQPLPLSSYVAVDDDEDMQPTTVAELEHDEHEGLDEKSLLEHEEITKVKNIANVMFGRHIMECWYFSPFPREFTNNGPVDVLFFCEFTLRFFRTKDELVRFQSKSYLQRHPPGNEVYRDSNVSMFELDGAVEKVYCQNLCYFAKLFLDHKTLYWDVDPFLFYVLCSEDERGYHPVGFFSKEKYSDLGYNLACILTFPCAQRKGYGRFLIAFSYELSKKEEKVGSPEKPLSDLGALSYKSYWASTLLVALRSYSGSQLSIMDLTKITSILVEDVAATLHMLGLLQYVNGNYVIYAPPSLLVELMQKYPVDSGLQLDAEKLVWFPSYVQDPKKDKWAIRAKKDSNAGSSNDSLGF